MDCSPPGSYGSKAMGFFTQEYQNGLLFPTPGHLPNSRIKPTSPVSSALQVDFLPTKPKGRVHVLFHFFEVVEISV